MIQWARAVSPYWRVEPRLNSSDIDGPWVGEGTKRPGPVGPPSAAESTGEMWVGFVGTASTFR